MKIIYVEKAVFDTLDQDKIGKEASEEPQSVLYQEVDNAAKKLTGRCILL